MLFRIGFARDRHTSESCAQGCLRHVFSICCSCFAKVAKWGVCGGVGAKFSVRGIEVRRSLVEYMWIVFLNPGCVVRHLGCVI